MPKGFTDEETKFIKEKLILKGKELIAKYGYKKFGIRDLTAEVGIANGMFYKFFHSKEDLFFLILDKEKKIVREKISAEMFKHKDNPAEALKGFYYVTMKELNENPIMETILLNKEYGLITQVMTEEEMIEERNKSLEPLLEITNYWKEKALIKDIDIELVLSSLRSLVYLWFYKQEIGEDIYPQIIDFMVKRICDYTNV